MNLEKYHHKYVKITDIFGETFTGTAEYAIAEFLMHEYGKEEEGIFIEDVLLYRSQIASIEEIQAHGTVCLYTENLILRRYVMEDADVLYKRLGTDPQMYRYSGWNPYATPEMAKETVARFIEEYEKPHTYSWVMELDDILVGTIGAYDYHDNQIEVGFSVVPAWQGRGFATEALRAVLAYLTENEGIACVTAWCASENEGSRKVLVKAGMHYVSTDIEALDIGQKLYDKLNFEYRCDSCSAGLEQEMTDGQNDETGIRLIQYTEEEIEAVPAFDRTFLDGILPLERYERYSKAAAQDDAFALSELGNIDLVNGFYGHDEERRQKGIRCLEKAAELGEKGSATFLGYCYKNGNYGFEQNMNKAVTWFKKGADMDDMVGKIEYENAIRDGFAEVPSQNGPEDQERTTYIDEDFNQEKYEILEHDAMKGIPLALYEYGMVEMIYGNMKGAADRKIKGFAYLEKAVEKGSAAAATYIGTIYHEGKFGYPKDMTKAVSWYQKGAEMGDPQGMSNYAVALQNGEGGVQKDYAKAFELIRKAADAGLGIAQYNAALALHAGRGTAIDRKLAKKYFQMAAANGIEMAKMWLYSLDYKD